MLFWTAVLLLYIHIRLATFIFIIHFFYRSARATFRSLLSYILCLIKVWDLRKNALAYKMRGHNESVTGMDLSPDGSYLLTNAMDDSLRIWDVRPYAPKERCVKILQVCYRADGAAFVAAAAVAVVLRVQC